MRGGNIRITFKQNLGTIDRVIRSIIGLALIGVSTALFPVWSWAAVGIGGVLIMEAAGAY
ncbi:MAG: DUF2892 domain-containing protein [Bacillota bacterium]